MNKLFPLSVIFSSLLSGCGGGGSSSPTTTAGGTTTPTPTTNISALTFNPAAATEALYKSDLTVTLNAQNTTRPILWQIKYTNIGIENIDGAAYSAIQRLSIFTDNGIQQTPSNTKMYYIGSPFRPYIPREPDRNNGWSYATTYSNVTIPTSVKVGDFGVLYTGRKEYTPLTVTGERCYTSCPTVDSTVTYAVESDTATTVYFCEIILKEKNCLKINSSNQVVGMKRIVNDIIYQ